MKSLEPEAIQFALDIGTHGVTGLLYRSDDADLTLLATTSQVYTERAMLDGQIHDIAAVTKVISAVATALQTHIEQPLREVTVAAAGRALRTAHAEATVQLQNAVCSASDVERATWEALQEARKEAGSYGTDRSPLHLVGYSIRECLLDGSPILSLVGQRGRTATVQLIATFLPRVVIDSLDSALRGAHLAMRGLTLEPIAALAALVPPSMRKLNLVLVDIGAGTSDIAITYDGTVQAYGMVPIAGDEITEALAEDLLLDFPVAERLKCALAEDDVHTYTDVLGNVCHMTAKKLIARIAPAIDRLADEISREILRLNQKAPAAVLLIGGGAKTPLLENRLAARLDLTADRVRMRTRESIPHVNGCEEVLRGPESVTPIGIAITARQSAILPLTIVDGEVTHRVFSFQPLTVRDALHEAGITPAALQPRPGRAITVYIEGQRRAFPGTLGHIGCLLRGDIPVLLDETVVAGDELTLIRASDGVDGHAIVADVIGSTNPHTLWVNGQIYEVAPIIRVNGRLAHTRLPLSDGDEIVCTPMSTGDAIAACTGLTLQHQVNIDINGQAVQLVRPNVAVSRRNPVTGALTESPIESLHETPVEEGSRFIVTPVPGSSWRVRDALREAGIAVGSPLQIQLNGSPRVLTGELSIVCNDVPCQLDDKIADGDKIRVTAPSSAESLTMSSVLLLLGDSLRHQSSGKERLVLRRNGQNAAFTTPILHGDDIQVYWETQRETS